MAETRTIPRPDWLDKHPNDWPPEARIVFNLLATAVERRLAHIAEHEQAVSIADKAVAG